MNRKQVEEVLSVENTIVCEFDTPDNEHELVPVELDLVKWDQLTPRARHTFILESLNAHLCTGGLKYSYKVQCGGDDNFEKYYIPMRDCFSLTVEQMQKEDMLMKSWEVQYYTFDDYWAFEGEMTYTEGAAKDEEEE